MSKVLINITKIASIAILWFEAEGAALAADYSSQAPYQYATSGWTGLHVGGYIQATCLDTVYVPPGTDPELAGCTAIAGLLGGYDFQINNWVLGLEGDFGWGHRIARNSLDNVVYDFDTMASIRPRLGYAFDTTLIYGTGGIAWVDATLTQTALGESASQWHTGWVAGGGIEHQLTDHLDVRLEYLYGHYDDQTYRISCGCTIDGGLDSVHTVRAGLTWKFAFGQSW